MNQNDFRYMRQGKALGDLKKSEYSLLKPIKVCNTQKRQALLLLHGFSSSPAVYRYLIAQLKCYDGLFCPLLAGHGESITALSGIKAAGWLLQARQAYEALLNEYQKVDVLGLSLGGLLACKLSQDFAFNRLFLLAPALKLQMNTSTTMTLLLLLKKLGFRELRSTAGDLLSKEYAELTYRRLPIATVIEVLNFVQQHQWVAPSCPVDLFLGRHDAIVASQEVAKLFTGLSNVSTHWLNDSAHILPLEKDVDQIVACINQRM